MIVNNHKLFFFLYSAQIPRNGCVSILLLFLFSESRDLKTVLEIVPPFVTSQRALLLYCCSLPGLSRGLQTSGCQVMEAHIKAKMSNFVRGLLTRGKMLFTAVFVFLVSMIFVGVACRVCSTLTCTAGTRCRLSLTKQK